jgi:hypothetical protein
MMNTQDAQQRPPQTTNDAGSPMPSDEYSLTVGPGDYWSKVDADLGARITCGLGLETPQPTGARA